MFAGFAFQLAKQNGIENPFLKEREAARRKWLQRLLSRIPKSTRVNQKVKAIFKLRGNRGRKELARWAVLPMPVEEFSHVQYSALPSVE